MSQLTIHLHSIILINCLQFRDEMRSELEDYFSGESLIEFLSATDVNLDSTTAIAASANGLPFPLSQKPSYSTSPNLKGHFNSLYRLRLNLITIYLTLFHRASTVGLGCDKDQQRGDDVVCESVPGGAYICSCNSDGSKKKPGNSCPIARPSSR